MSIETNIEVKLTNRDRKSAFFRLILVIPIAVWAGTITNSSIAFNSLGFISGSVALSLLFTGKLPEQAGKYIYALISFWNEIVGYALVLVTDEYPGFSLGL